MNPAAQQSGTNAIGGSGTSGYMPAADDLAPDRDIKQLLELTVSPVGPAWQVDIDFASEDPGDASERSLTGAVDLAGGAIFLRVVDTDDDADGDVQFYQPGTGGWQSVPGLGSSVIFDDDVETTPLVHHITFTADFAQQVTYDVTVTNSDGTEFTATGVSLFNGTPSATGGVTGFNFHTFLSDGDYLLDNVVLTSEQGPIPGDANEDGKVTDADAAILATNWQQCDVGWSEGDFNNDGCVTDADAAILATHWQEGVTEGAAPVPEPGMLVLLAGAVASAWLLRRR